MTSDAPPPPDPWATTHPREGLRDNNAAVIQSLTPAECKDLVGNVVVPGFANLVDFCGHDENYEESVRFTSQKVLVFRSLTQHVHGGGSGGKCDPYDEPKMVRAKGSPVMRHGDKFWMDDHKTMGAAKWTVDTETYPAPLDTDPFPGSAVLTLVDSYAPAFREAPNVSPGELPTGRGALGTTPPSTSNVPQLRQRGPWSEPPQPRPGPGAGEAAARLAVLLGLAEMGSGLGDMAGQYYHGSDFAKGAAIDSYLKGQLAGPQWGEVGLQLFERPETRANDLLSLKAGRDVDFRTMDPEELEELLRQPWPSPAEMRNNREKLRAAREERDKVRRDYDATLADGPADNVRVSSGRRGPDPRNPCLLIPYGLLECPVNPDTDKRSPAHHVVADRAFRSGSRTAGVWDTTGYINGMSEGAGLAICLDGDAAIPTTPHGRATTIYDTATQLASQNGMVQLSVAELSGAAGVEAATNGRCKAAEVAAQLRAYHQAHGMGPATWVRQSNDTVPLGRIPPLGSQSPLPPVR